MPLTYKRSDEKPAFAATVQINGVLPDYSTGYTFTCRLAPAATLITALTKTTGITGTTLGVITVAWAAGELDLAPGTYVLHLTATQTAGTLEATIDDILIIEPRLT